jgi:hypothetical protein
MKTLMMLLFFTCGVLHEAFAVIKTGFLNTEHSHISLCANSIFKKYFTPGRNLLLSLQSSITGHDTLLKTQDIMLNSIHNGMQWQVRVVRPDPILNAEPDNDDIPDSYLLFAGPQSNDSDILLDLSQQVELISSKSFLNRRARFLVVAVEHLTTTPKFLALSIFRKLYESYKIVNLVVIVSIYRPDIPHLRQILPYIKINNLYVYSWFPIVSYDSHDAVRAVTCSDKSLVEGKGHLFNQGNLFPEKIPIGLKDVPIKVSGYFPDIRTQSDLHSSRENKNKLNIFRLEIDFIKLTLQQLNLTISYDFQTANNRSDINVYRELLLAVLFGKTDITVGGLPLDYRLLYYGEPTIPYFQTPIMWYVPFAKPLGHTGMMFRVLTFPVWISCAFVFLAVTVTTWLLALHTKGTESKRYMHISSCCYILWSITVGVSISKMPQSPRLRLLLLQWVVHCLVITTVFQAYFTSFLVQPDMGNQIRSVQELAESGLEYGYTSTYEKYIELIEGSSYDKIREHRSICTSFVSCVERAITSDFATLSTPYLVDNILRTKISDGLTYPICSLPHNIAVYRASMYVSKGSPLLIPINHIIRRLTESGLGERYFGYYRNVSTKECGSLMVIKKRYTQNVDNYIAFTLSHLHLAFVSLFTGFGICFIVFICEVTYQN